MSLKDFQVISKLGEGAFSSVYKVKRLEDGQEYALKKVKLQNLNEKEKQNSMNEVRILASVKHPNIICYKEAFIDLQSNSLCIVMELADGSDLYQKIVNSKKNNKQIEEQTIWNIFIQIVRGLKALHELKILHRDLKSANVFLSQNGDVKLGDMNVSKVAKKGLLYTQTGTPFYASPEVWKDQPYDQKSDIWSLGCVIYEMAALKPPFHAENMEALYQRVIRGYYPKIPQNYSQDLNNAIRSMLQVQPHLRPNCDKLLQFPSILKRQDEIPQPEQTENEPNTLLQTIKFPKNYHYFTSMLPKPCYDFINRKQIKSLHSQQASPNPRQIMSVNGSYEDVSSQQTIEKGSVNVVSKKPNHPEILMILDQQNKQIRKPIMKIRPNRHQSQAEVSLLDVITQQQSKISLENHKLPILEELSPNKRKIRPNKNRNQSLPNANLLPLIQANVLK
ncbi:unnamed protein product [Paramecium sonneborni]|uniref:non-specific serine/threonine protein kinase n=1 Tax=Paramecium sonneborni TaxID=65129 RepID=A0A8S1QU64_9CILI|nr:unnamed protein product [Paramecium sonneborni]